MFLELLIGSEIGHAPKISFWVSFETCIDFFHIPKGTKTGIVHQGHGVIVLEVIKAHPVHAISPSSKVKTGILPLNKIRHQAPLQQASPFFIWKLTVRDEDQLRKQGAHLGQLVFDMGTKVIVFIKMNIQK